MIHYITEFCSFAVRSDTPGSGPLAVVQVIPGKGESEWGPMTVFLRSELGNAVTLADHYERWDTEQMNARAKR
jgi:hypothetical protein